MFLEQLICAFFDGNNNFLGDVQISKGAVNYAYVSPRDIFRYAFDYEAVMFILLWLQEKLFMMTANTTWVKLLKQYMKKQMK